MNRLATTAPHHTGLADSRARNTHHYALESHSAHHSLTPSRCPHSSSSPTAEALAAAEAKLAEAEAALAEAAEAAVEAAVASEAAATTRAEAVAAVEAAPVPAQPPAAPNPHYLSAGWLSIPQLRRALQSVGAQLPMRDAYERSQLEDLARERGLLPPLPRDAAAVAAAAAVHRSR